MFVFDCTSICSYNEYKVFITNIKRDFDQNKSQLFYDYGILESSIFNSGERYFEFRKKYRDLRQSLIKKVLNKFRLFLPSKCLIYEFGSLTKQTDRIESDTDLTICYDDEKKDIFECVEELINYSIVYVFEQSIDHVHGKFQHYPISHEYDHLTEDNNLYKLVFNDGTIEYKCGPETLCENIMSIKNVRDYNSLIDGYREKYTLKCNIDCLYSIEILENTTSHDFIEDLSVLEQQNNIFSAYRYSLKKYYINKEVEISYLKLAFKNTIVDLYIMLAYLRKKANWLDQYSMTMEKVFKSEILQSIFGVEFINELKILFIKMVFYWDKLELVLKKNKIPLSSRCHLIMTKEQINDLLFSQYGKKQLMDTILDSINDLSLIVQRGWKLIKNKYE